MALKHFHEDINETTKERFMRFTKFQFSVDTKEGKFMLHTDDSYEEPSTVMEYSHYLTQELGKYQSKPDTDYP